MKKQKNNSFFIISFIKLFIVSQKYLGYRVYMYICTARGDIRIKNIFLYKQKLKEKHLF